MTQAPLSKILAGFTWHSTFKLGLSGLAAVKLIILARLLSPEIFGLYSLLLVSIGLSEAATETGINTTLIQEPKKIDPFLNTAWILAIIRGVCIAALMLGVGWLLATLYSRPEILRLVALCSLVPIIKGWINPASIGFYKDLSFGADTVYRASVVVCETLATVAWALISPTIYAFIFGLVVGALVEVIASFLIFSLKPKLAFDKRIARKVLNNAKGLLPISLLAYLVENIDNVIVGRLTGTAALGVYHNAYGISYKLTGEQGKSVGHGSFPVYTALVSSNESILTTFKATKKRAVILLLGLTLIGVFAAKPLVAILLGSEWSGAIALIPILTISGFFHGLNRVYHPFLIAHKKYQGIIIELFLALLIIIGGFWWSIPTYGLVGAAYTMLLARISSSFVLRLYTNRVTSS